MKGFVFDIQKFALHDGPGIRTAVFIKGCELKCSWCCNPESQLPSPQLAFDVKKCTSCFDCVNTCSNHALSESGGMLKVDFHECTGCGDCTKSCYYGALKVFGYSATPEEIVSEVLKDKAYFNNSGGGITVSGGDPIFQPEFTYSILSLAKENGIHTCLETSGFCKQEIIEKLATVTDLFLFDFKHHKNQDHQRYTGVSNEVILKNLDYLCRNNHSVYLRCPVIPGINNTLQHFQAITELSNKYDSVREVEIMSFHDWGFHKYEMIGMMRPDIKAETVTKEIKKQWIDTLVKLGCQKIKKS